ncbi:hypothetical protein YC2023_008862 [Brassica napus]
MVAYIKNNFFLVFMIVLLLVVSSYARFSMMVTKGEVESICNKKDVDSTLCFEVLKPNPTIAKLDFTGLANFLINYTSRNISDVLKEIKLYESNTTDLQTIKLCEELYDLSLFSDDHALKALAAKNYDSVNFKVGGTLENIVTCNEELSTMKPVPQSLIAKNNSRPAENLDGFTQKKKEELISGVGVLTADIETGLTNRALLGFREEHIYYGSSSFQLFYTTRTNLFITLASGSPNVSRLSHSVAIMDSHTFDFDLDHSSKAALMQRSAPLSSLMALLHEQPSRTKSTSTSVAYSLNSRRTYISNSA